MPHVISYTHLTIHIHTHNDFGVDPNKIWSFQSNLSHGNGPEITELPGHDPARFLQSSGKPPRSIRRLVWHHWRSPCSQWPFKLLPCKYEAKTLKNAAISRVILSEVRTEERWITHKLCSSPSVCTLTFSYESHSSFIWYGFYIFIIFSHIHTLVTPHEARGPCLSSV